MANKNTKRIRAEIRKDGKAGNSEVALTLPSGGYHNTSKGAFATKRFPTAQRGGKGIVSSNTKRNSAMVVSHNTDNHGNKFSLTTHEKLHGDRPMVFKGHNYLSYRTPASDRSH